MAYFFGLGLYVLSVSPMAAAGGVDGSVVVAADPAVAAPRGAVCAPNALSSSKRRASSCLAAVQLASLSSCSPWLKAISLHSSWMGPKIEWGGGGFRQDMECQRAILTGPE